MLWKYGAIQDQSLCDSEPLEGFTASGRKCLSSNGVDLLCTIGRCLETEHQWLFNSVEECAIMQTEVNTLTGENKNKGNKILSILLGFYFCSFMLDSPAHEKSDWPAPHGLLIGCD